MAGAAVVEAGTDGEQAWRAFYQSMRRNARGGSCQDRRSVTALNRQLIALRAITAFIARKPGGGGQTVAGPRSLESSASTASRPRKCPGSS